MKHASLFSGIGGAELAASWMGWENIFHCEINPFGRKVLEYWFPKSKSYEDIKTTDFREWKGRVDVLTGGFPCQPFSRAGKRGGDTDDRYLWPEMLRAIREIQPTWVVGENVAGITSMVESGEDVEMGRGSNLFEESIIYRKEQQFTVERICKDFESIGYSVQPVIIPACAVGAPHRRDRVWFIANRNGSGIESEQGRKKLSYKSEPATDTDGVRQRRWEDKQECVNGGERETNNCVSGEDGVASYAPNARLQGEMSRNSKLSSEYVGFASDSKCGRSNKIYNENKSEKSDGHGVYGTSCKQSTTDTDGDGFFGCNGKDEKQPDEGGLNALNDIKQDTFRKTDWQNFPTQSPVCRGNDGLPFDVDDLAISFPKWRRESIKAYGNAWVPQVAYQIFLAIEKSEDE